MASSNSFVDRSRSVSSKRRMKTPSILAGKKKIEESRSGIPYMQKARGAGGETDAGFHKVPYLAYAEIKDASGRPAGRSYAAKIRLQN